MTNENESLEIASVVSQFSESRRTLESIAEELTAIQYAEDRASTASQSLETSANQLENVTRELGRLTAELSTATEIVKESLTKASNFFEESRADLTALRSDMTALKQETESNFQNSDRSFETKLEDIRQLIGTAIENIEERAKAEAKLNTLEAALPSRVKKRLGMQT